MLEVVAHYDPVDYHKLRRLVDERFDGVYDAERHRTALSSLNELSLIERGGISHEYIHITDEGWSHLGGETPRHDDDVGPVDAPVCDVCAEDELVESEW